MHQDSRIKVDVLRAAKEVEAWYGMAGLHYGRRQLYRHDFALS